MKLQDYYLEANIYEPPNIHQREFGVRLKRLENPETNPAGMWRHLAFSDMSKLRSFLFKQQPLHVYFSAAKYTDPGNTIMAEKGWLGADLIFDIDYDALKEPSLGEAAYQIMELRKILADKFALKDMVMTFTGGRGYHIHVRDECIQSLNKNEREQIAEYVIRYGIEIDAPVTCDLSRLIRLPGSIHGKTGKECRILDMVKIA